MSVVTHKGYSYRIYPSKSQKKKIEKTFEAVCFVYNHFLDEKIRIYKEEERSINVFEMSRMLTEFKREPENAWLYEVNSGALLNAIKDLDRAYQNFFKRVKRGEKPGFPKYKKISSRQSFRVNKVRNNLRLEGDKILVPKMGLMRKEGTQSFKGEILSITITQAPSGKYFASLNVREDVEPKKNEGGQIGIVLNMNGFYTDSNGKTVDRPKELYSYAHKRIAFYQPLLQNAQKDSLNYQDIRRKISLMYETMNNFKTVLQHRESIDIVRKNDFIVLCNYPLKEMMIERKKDAINLRDISWYDFICKLKYKAFEHGATVVLLPKDYCFIQTCSECGFEDLSKKNMYSKEWVCPKCGSKHPFHENMAKSILEKGYIVDAERKAKEAEKAAKKAKQKARKKKKEEEAKVKKSE